MIVMKKQTAVVIAEHSYKEYAKLVAIFVFLIISATTMSTLGGINVLEWLRWFMGGFMLFFGSLKLMGVETFIKVFPLYDLIAKRVRPYKYVYPFLQILLGISFFIGSFDYVRELLVVVLSISSLVGIVGIVTKRGAVRFSYLGTIIKLRFSSVVILENIIMLVASILMLIANIAS